MNNYFNTDVIFARKIYLALFLWISIILLINVLIFRTLVMPYNILAIEIFVGLNFLITGYLFYIKDWGKDFVFYLFFFSLLFRVVGVIFYYVLFSEYNGEPFQILNNDEMWYDGQGAGLAEYIRQGQFNVAAHFVREFSDIGYPYFLALVYSIFGDNIIIARLIQAVLSSITVVYAYKLVRIFYSNDIAKLAAIFIMLSPILIQYCGINLKETVFVFLIIACLYRFTLFVKKGAVNFYRLSLVLLFTFALFAFRPAVGLSVIVTYLTYYLFRSENNKTYAIRIIGILALGFIFIFLLYLSPAFTEVSGLLDKSETYSDKVILSSGSGILAKFAGLPVFMVVAMAGPFPNLLNVNELPDQLLALHLMSMDGILKGILAFFALTGLWFAFRKNFRNSLLLIVFFITNFIIITFAGVAFNFRYQLPVLPIFLVFAAIGVINMSRNKYILFNIYMMLYVALVIMFNYFKLQDSGITLI